MLFREGVDGVVILALAIEAEVDEDPIVAVSVGWSQLLLIDGQDTSIVLARALGDELLDPDAKWRQCGRCHYGELVSATLGTSTDCCSQERGRIVRTFESQLSQKPPRRLEKSSYVEADQCRRQEAEIGECRIAPADLGVVELNSSKAEFSGERRQAAVRIGDGDELAPHGRAHRIPSSVEEEFEEGAGLDSAPRFRRRKKQCLREWEALRPRLNVRRISAVEDAEVEESGRNSENSSENLRCKARAPQAEQECICKVFAAAFRRQALKVTDSPGHDFRTVEPSEFV